MRIRGLFHSLAGKGRAGGREGKVNDAEGAVRP